jgi:hypothetical protein
MAAMLKKNLAEVVETDVAGTCWAEQGSGSA